VSTGAVSCALGDPTTAMQVGQLKAILRAECAGRTEIPEASSITNPLRITLGSEPQVDLLMGNIVSGPIFFILLVLLHVILVLVWMAWKRIPFWSAAESLSFPGRSVTFLVMFVQPLLTSSLFVLVYSKQALFRVVAALMIAFILVFNLLLTYFLLVNFPAEFVKFPDTSAQEESDAWKYLSRLRTYLVGKRGEWKDKKSFSNKKGFSKKFQALFQSYIEPYQYFLAVESAYCVALSILDFQIVHDINHCRSLNGILVLVLVSFISVVIWLRPFNKTIAFHLFLLTYGFQLVSAVIAFARAMLDNSVERADDQTHTMRSLESVSNVCVFLSMIALSCKTFVDLVTKADWVRKKYEQHKQKKERKKQQQERSSELGSDLAENTVMMNEMQMIGAPSTTLPSPVPDDSPLESTSQDYMEFQDYQKNLQARGGDLQPVVHEMQIIPDESETVVRERAILEMRSTLITLRRSCSPSSPMRTAC